ncbi:uncharacterized protein LOC117804741 [Notolabrus celidotus]|uniref:uncharacterized protein LOC117804741 n=1 Tax=Notolabrus celidotus TaxID=1203425 RepID=UPI00148FC774|nr:uncharacterized protein LOC117804741 [Notolabrus celidotus]
MELHGVPLEVDLQFAPQNLLLVAQDRDGLSTWLPLTIDLRHSPFDPCHVFTITVHRSLQSILRQRHRVELLLRKLSGFFNSSSNQHLSVVSMKHGSTVVSFYNTSLCGAGQCSLDQIHSMWFAMRSTDASVNPAFREAMLPEFPITKVGSVSYRQDCFSTSTPTFSGSTPAFQTTLKPSLSTNTSLNSTSNICTFASPANSQQITHYQKMAAMFTALLVVCLLILIVILVAVVLHSWKVRERSRTTVTWPAGRVDKFQRDLRAIRPRRSPIFEPELPPPPLQLWFDFSQGDEHKLPSTFEQERNIFDNELQPRLIRHDSSSI